MNTIADVTLSEPRTSYRHQDYGGNSVHSYISAKLTECVSAFEVWETALRRTDHHLYMALGRLYVLMHDTAIDLTQLKELAAERGIRVKRTRDTSILLAKLVFSEDRRKASKYAGALKFLQSRSVVPDAEIVSEYIKDSGGLEQCLKTFRQECLSTRVPSPVQGERSSTDVIAFLATFPSLDPPLGLDLENAQGSHFILVAIRSDTGQVRLIQQVVQDDALLRKTMYILAQNSALDALPKRGRLLS